MSVYLGIDLGSTTTKAVLIDDPALRGADALTATLSRSSSTMSSAVTSSGAIEREIRYRSGFSGCRTLTWP